MRLKHLLVYTLFLLPLAASATTTVSGHISTLGTTSVTSSSYVRFYLRGCGGNQPRINGTSVIAPTQGGTYFFDFPVNASGNVSGSLYSTRDSAGTGNGEIECGGSLTSVWYGMVIFNSGKGGPEIPIHAKNGGTLDVSNVTPITTSPVVNAPAGDTTYLRIDAGNVPFLGNFTPSGNGTLSLGASATRWKFFGTTLDLSGAATLGGGGTLTGTFTGGTFSGQTFTSATFTSPTITTPTVSSPTTTGTDSGTETLTNKTLTAPVITSPSTTGTDSGAETLTNKTLTAPAISNASSTGTDSGTETFFNKTLNTPKVTGGIDNDSSGYKHKRFGATCTTAASAGSFCTTTFSWTTAFADTSYTAMCTPVGPTNTGVFSLQSFNAAGVTVEVVAATAAAASYSSVDCVGVHD